MKVKKKSGIALILAVGILAVLSVVAVGFTVFAQLELKASTNYTKLIKAELIAEAGIARALEELKYGTEGIKQNAYDTTAEAWWYQGDVSASGVLVDIDGAVYPSFDGLNTVLGDGISGTFAGGTYKLKVIDCAGRIDINAFQAASANLSDMLEELGLSSAQAQNLISLRDLTLPDGRFSSVEEIKLASGIGDAAFNSIKNYVTLYGQADTGDYTLNETMGLQAGHTDKVFVNVNTAPQAVLKAVLRPMMDSDTECDNLAAAIITQRANNPFDGASPDINVFNFLSARGEFHRFLDYAQNPAGLGIISAANRDSVKTQSDPNRGVTNSTHFCFDGGGYYEIECVGSFQGAKKKIKKVVRLFCKIYQTSRAEFDNAAATTTRVTWKDSCPINYAVLETHIYDPNTAVKIADAIKNGFWDDFSEDYDTSGTQAGEWVALEQRFEVNRSGNGYLRTWPIGGFVLGVDYFPKLELNSTKWKFSDFSIRARMIDETSASKSAVRLNLPWPAMPSAWAPFVAPTATCPTPPGPKSTQCHERFMNVSHLQFGTGAAYCSFPQAYDIFDESPNVDNAIYGSWVDYDGTGYIYFAPSPDVKPYSVVSQPQLMIYCNDWVWFGHNSIDGTKTFPFASYYVDKSLYIKVRGGLGIATGSQVDAAVYYPAGSLSASTNEPLMDATDRPIRFVGMGNLFDIDTVRIIPWQGVYTSGSFDPTGSGSSNIIEWGTISAGVTMSDNAQTATEKIYLTTNFSGGEDLTVIPGSRDPAPASAHPASGGPVGGDTSSDIEYRIYLFSGDGDLNNAFKEQAVVEDVTVTYLPRTDIVYQCRN
ncbi:MAG: hypothetical protein ABII75_03670 [Candidatus Omnitrophota bacterium]